MAIREVSVARAEAGARAVPVALTPALARQLGISRAHVRHQVDRGFWSQLTRGVVITQPSVGPRAAMVAAGVALAGPTAAVTGWDAIDLLCPGRPRPADAAVVVLTREGHNRSADGVRIRVTERPYRTQWHPAAPPAFEYRPVVHGARAVSDALLGSQFLPPVMSLVAFAVQNRVCTVEQLTAELEEGPRNGSGMLRHALAEIGRAESVAEVDAARALVRSGVPEFEQNVRVVDSSTRRTVGRTDVLWRSLRAGLEIDSRAFHFDVDDWDDTMSRHTDLTRFGLAVAHYTPSRVARDPSRFGTEVNDWLRRRSLEVGVELPPPAARTRPTGEPAPLLV